MRRDLALLMRVYKERLEKKEEEQKGKNIQQRVFASGHPPNY
jgi:hypothetical protein